MNENEYKKRLDILFTKWQSAREGYKGFTEDGILDYKKWKVQTPKILFLLKEGYNDVQFNGPIPADEIRGKFWLNLCRWRQALIEIYKDQNAKPTLYDNDEYREEINDIALVELKKNDEGKKTSSNEEILQYAIKDRKFIIEEIDELIKPHIVFCCYTIESYKEIYNLKDKNIIISEDKKANTFCLKHGNRLIIDFYHPSTPYKPAELFDGLWKLFKNKNIFNQFNW